MVYYILKDKIPVQVDVLEYAKWYEENDNRVTETEIGDVHISTIFLGLDQRFGLNPENPILFETMIFGGKYDRERRRCSTWEQAEIMHQEMVDLVKSD